MVFLSDLVSVRMKISSCSRIICSCRVFNFIPVCPPAMLRVQIDSVLGGVVAHTINENDSRMIRIGGMGIS